MKITAVTIVFSEALRDPTFFIILLNIDLFYTNWNWYNTSVRQQKKHLYLRCCWSCSQANLRLIFSQLWAAPSFLLSNALWSKYCTLTTQHKKIKSMNSSLCVCGAEDLQYSGGNCSKPEKTFLKWRKKKKLCVTRNPTHLKTPFTTCVISCCLTFTGCCFSQSLFCFVSVLITAVWFTSLSVSHDCSWYIDEATWCCLNPWWRPSAQNMCFLNTYFLPLTHFLTSQEPWLSLFFETLKFVLNRSSLCSLKFRKSAEICLEKCPIFNLFSHWWVKMNDCRSRSVLLVNVCVRLFKYTRL